MRLAASSRRMAVHGKCVRWVLIVLFCLVLGLVGPVRAQSSAEGANISTPSCNDEYLITVENTTEGIIVNVLNKRNSVLQYQKFEGRYLSSECGEHYFRCKDLFVMTSTSTVKNKTILYHIVFVPLHDGILLLKYLYNGASLSKTDDYFLEISIGCSPTFISEISGNIFAVCLNQEKRNATVLRVYLNSTSIEHSRVSSPLIISNGLTNLSDFKYINSDDSHPNDQQIVFASSNYIHSFAPLSYLSYPLGILGNCSVPGSLAYAPDDVLLVYCHDDSAVYFSLSHEHAINQTQYSEHGQPFLCPNPDVRIAVFASASYVQYTVWSNNSRENFNIHDMKFDSGVCVGSIKHTLFAYNDKDKGVYVLDTATSNLARLSSKACLNSQCEPLLVFQNRYIVIREREKYDADVIVVDSQQNYAAVITAEHVRADLLTLLIEQDSSFCSNGSLSPNTSTPTILPPSGKQNIGKIVGGSIAGFVVLLVCSGVVITAFILVHQKLRKSPYPLQETVSSAERGQAVTPNGRWQALSGARVLRYWNRKSSDVHDGSAPVGDGHVIPNHGLNNEPHGHPALLPEVKQVYVSSETATNQPPHATAEDQQDNPYTQGSSDVNHNSTSTPVTGGGGATSSERQLGATARLSITPEQDPGSQQAGANAHPAREASEASNKPMEQDDLCTSSDISPLHGGASNPEDEWMVEPKPEDKIAREFDSDDQLAHGKEKPVPRRKSLHATRRKMRKKRAERGDHEYCDYRNLEEQLAVEEMKKD